MPWSEWGESVPLWEACSNKLSLPQVHMCCNSSDRLWKVVVWQLQAENDGLVLEDEWKVTQSSDTASRLYVCLCFSLADVILRNVENHRSKPERTAQSEQCLKCSSLKSTALKLRVMLAFSYQVHQEVIVNVRGKTQQSLFYKICRSQSTSRELQNH